MKKKTAKLSLARHTVRSLDARDLSAAAGGTLQWTQGCGDLSRLVTNACPTAKCDTQFCSAICYF